MVREGPAVQVCIFPPLRFFPDSPLISSLSLSSHFSSLLLRGYGGQSLGSFDSRDEAEKALDGFLATQTDGDWLGI